MLSSGVHLAGVSEIKMIHTSTKRNEYLVLNKINTKYENEITSD